MQKQIQRLTTEIKHLKKCNTLSNRNENESTEVAEENIEIFTANIISR